MSKVRHIWTFDSWRDSLILSLSSVQRQCLKFSTNACIEKDSTSSKGQDNIVESAMDTTHSSAVQNEKAMKNVVVGKHWVLGNQIGQGFHSVVYSGTEIVKSPCRKVLKVGNLSDDPEQMHKKFEEEYNVYKHLENADQDGQDVTFSKAFWFGIVRSQPVIVLERHGPNLDQVQGTLGHFSGRDIILLAMSLIHDLKYMHNIAGIYHGDVHSGNILLGLPHQQRQFYLTDFGESAPLVPEHQSASIENNTSRSWSKKHLDLLDLASMLKEMVYRVPFKSDSSWYQIMDLVKSFKGYLREYPLNGTIEYDHMASMFRSLSEKQGLSLAGYPDCLMSLQSEENCSIFMT